MESRMTKRPSFPKQEATLDGSKIARLGSWDWHVQTGKLTWSDETFRLYGYAPGSVDVSYELFVSHLHPEIRQSIVEAIQRTLTESALSKTSRESSTPMVMNASSRRAAG